MNPVSIGLLSRMFTIGGFVLGLPSLAVLAFYAVHLLRRLVAAPTVETQFGDNPDAVMRLLQGLSQGIGAVAHLAGSIAQWVLDIAAEAAGAGLLLAVACWFTGRGLQAHATWARASASLVLGLTVLVALLLALSLRGLGRVPMLALVVFGVLGIHALWVGAPPSASRGTTIHSR